jgi:hypothetical protein
LDLDQVLAGAGDRGRSCFCETETLRAFRSALNQNGGRDKDLANMLEATHGGRHHGRAQACH